MAEKFDIQKTNELDQRIADILGESLQADALGQVALAGTIKTSFASAPESGVMADKIAYFSASLFPYIRGAS